MVTVAKEGPRPRWVLEEVGLYSVRVGPNQASLSLSLSPPPLSLSHSLSPFSSRKNNILICNSSIQYSAQKDNA